MKASEGQTAFDFGGKGGDKQGRSYLEEYLEEADKDPLIKELSKAKRYRGEEYHYTLSKYRQDKTFLGAVYSFVRRGNDPEDKFEERDAVVEEKRNILGIKYAKLNVGTESVPLRLCKAGRINSAFSEMYKSVEKKVEKYQKLYDATLASDFGTIIAALTIATKTKDKSDQSYFRQILEEKFDSLTMDQQFEIETRYEKALRAFDIYSS